MTNYQGPGTYRHYKGGSYEVLGLALQEDSIEKSGGLVGDAGITFVIYRPLSPGSLLETRKQDFWARELSDFNAGVVVPQDGTDDGVWEAPAPRFERIG